MWKTSVSENLEAKLESFNNFSSSTAESTYENNFEYVDEIKIPEFSAVELFPGLKVQRYTPTYAMIGAHGYTWRDGTVYTEITYDEDFQEEVVMHEAVHNYFTDGHLEYQTRINTAELMKNLEKPMRIHQNYLR